MNRSPQMLMAVLMCCWVSGQIKGLEQRLKRLEKHHGAKFSADSCAVDASYSDLKRDPGEAAIQYSTDDATSQSIQPEFGCPVPSMQHPAKSHGRCDIKPEGPPSSSQAGRHCTSAHSTSTTDLIGRLQKRSQEVLQYLQESQASA